MSNQGAVRASFALALSLVLSASSPARAGAAQPGSYTTPDGRTSLELTRTAAGKTRFDIDEESENGHACTLQGTVTGAVGLADDGVTGQCRVTFRWNGKTLSVHYGGSACSADHCGPGVYLNDAGFLPLPAACRDKAYAATRRAFQAAYDARNYARAKALLTPVLHICGQVFDPIRIDRIENDLAIVDHHLGDDAGCRALLQGMAKDAARSDDDIAGDHGPAGWEEYRPVLHAARINLRLCKAP